MPNLSFALREGEPVDLVLTWSSSLYKNTTVDLRGERLLSFETKADLKRGKTHTLPDGAVLSVRLRSFLDVERMEVLLNGYPVPESFGDPEKVLEVGSTAGITYGVVQLAAGASAYRAHVPGALLSGAFGVAFVLLALGMRRGVAWATRACWALVYVETAFFLWQRVATHSGVNALFVVGLLGRMFMMRFLQRPVQALEYVGKGPAKASVGG